MEQFKRAQVIMLPTNVLSNISLSNKTNNLVYNNNKHDTLSMFTNQHLYIISDDEIKEGDLHITSDHSGFGFRKYKIIATTDTSLKVIIPRHNDFDSEYILPQPSQQFIEKYIESYNKGEVITDVLVEYEKNVEMRQGYPKPSTANGKTEWNYDKITSYNLKINPKDNTITIKKLKDSWNRKEIENKLNKLLRDYQNITHRKTSWSFDINKWIEENL